MDSKSEPNFETIHHLNFKQIKGFCDFEEKNTLTV